MAPGAQEKGRERERDERCGAAQGVYIGGAARGVGEGEEEGRLDWEARGGRGGGRKGEVSPGCGGDGAATLAAD